MRRTLTLFLILLFAAALCAAATGTSASLPAMSSAIPRFKPIVTTFDIYVGGVHLITADILFQEQNSKYRAHVVGHTYGVWHHFLPWDTDLQATGSIARDHFVPVEFETHDVYGKKVKITKIHFTKDGDAHPEFSPPNNDKNREQVTAAQRRGALDPVTALLQLLAYLAVEKNCNTSVAIFDGKRLFDITGHDVGHEDIDEGDYGVFKGNARTCDADFISVAGEWKEQERDKFWQSTAGSKGRDPFHIWLGVIDPSLPEMPIKIESGSVWGLIIMHMTKWRYATARDLKS